eukprot:CAMPEP_0170643730 /NCGR_PEP_ID=MMETSP0224-20130122/42059_1 /TAXON_ID=285029 /ORGANISM="Togula jolla, Strain CCCM 725" /LENGTH=62 /DNA_ID=CAMNT_0010974613 /DNA_START=133 /DNA_END=321 /DNA_ORIENTATION=+
MSCEDVVQGHFRHFEGALRLEEDRAKGRLHAGIRGLDLPHYADSLMGPVTDDVRIRAAHSGC